MRVCEVKTKEEKRKKTITGCVGISGDCNNDMISLSGGLGIHSMYVGACEASTPRGDSTVYIPELSSTTSTVFTSSSDIVATRGFWIRRGAIFHVTALLSSPLLRGGDTVSRHKWKLGSEVGDRGDSRPC
jgi:hypothetical protein